MAAIYKKHVKCSPVGTGIDILSLCPFFAVRQCFSEQPVITHYIYPSKLLTY